MIADIALALSIINSILWIVFAIAIKRVFRMLYPVFQSFGIMKQQNLINTSGFDIIGGADELSDAETDK